MSSIMNPVLHTVIVQSILEVSKDDFQTRRPSVPRGFKCTLDLIISDLLEQIIIYSEEGVAPGHIRVGEARSEANRLARRPETPVVDSWLNWHENRLNPGCWWVSCSFQKTIDFIEKVFQDPAVSRAGCLHNITWGTFLRHLLFINKNSEGWIPSIVEGECGWEDHTWNVKNHLIQAVQCVGHPVSNQEESTPEYWTQKFNKEESDKVIGMNPDWRLKFGYDQPEPTRVPEPELTPTQKNNESVRKLQEIIEAAAEKSEINEGEYLQLAQSLKGFFVSQ